MSSSVSYAYTVRQEELRRERERRAAEDALRKAAQRYEALRERAAALRDSWGGEIEVPGRLEAATATDTAGLRAASEAVQREVESAASRLDAQLREARVATVRAGIAKLGSGEGAPIEAAAALAERRRQRSADPGPEASGEDVEETLARLVGRLDPEADEEGVERVEDSIEAVRAAGTDAGREQAVAALRVCVQTANAGAARAAEQERALDELEERLDGCRGPEAGSARRLLAAARAGSDPPVDLVAAVDAAVAVEEHRSKADYVARQLGTVLAEMGYEVGPEFSTTLVAAGEVLVERPAWSGYAVAVSCSGDPAQLEFEVVRGAATRADQAARDLEVEREFCATRPEILGQLARAGVDASQARIVPEGTAALRVEPGLGAPRRQDATRRAAEREG